MAGTLGMLEDELWAKEGWRGLQHQATVIWGREKWEDLFPTLDLERQHMVADFGSKVGRAWMTHIPVLGLQDPQVLLNIDVIL